MNQHLPFQTVYKDPIYNEIEHRRDTYLQTDDGTVFNVNSELLSRKSKFFNNLFLIGEEYGQNTVIHDIKSDIFETILTYMCIDHVVLTTDNVMPLLVAADFLMIDSLLDECRNYVLRNKNVENFLSFFLTARRIKGLDDQDQCRRFLVLCFEKAVAHSMDDACRLSFRDLKYFLCQKSLNVSDEHIVWSVIEAWVQADPRDRLGLVPEFLRCMDPNGIDNELSWKIISSPIVAKNPFYKDLGDPQVTMSFMSVQEKAHTVIQFRNETSLSEPRLPRRLHVVARDLPRGTHGSELFVSYDDRLDLWRKVGEVPLKGAKPVVSGNAAFFLKDVGEGHFEFSGLAYDLLKEEVRDVAVPTVADYVVGELEGTVYALQTFGTAVQRYGGDGAWLDAEPPLYRVRVSGAHSVCGALHVLGEIGSGYMFLQVLDAATNHWCRAPPPAKRRTLARSAVYRDRIFLVAGRSVEFDEDVEEFEEDVEEVVAYYGRQVVIEEGDDEEGNDDGPDDDVAEDDQDGNVELDDNDDEEEDSISREVEVYDPVSNRWTAYPDLPFRFFPVFVSVVGDRLYVYKNSRRPVVFWDGSGEWKVSREGHEHLFDHSFAAVENEDVVEQVTLRNRTEDPSVWIESGLERGLSCNARGMTVY